MSRAYTLDTATLKNKVLEFAETTRTAPQVVAENFGKFIFQNFCQDSSTQVFLRIEPATSLEMCLDMPRVVLYWCAMCELLRKPTEHLNTCIKHLESV